MSAGRFELTREVSLRMIHHLWSPSLSDEENHRAYGICVRRHGHNIKVQVTVAGVLDQRSSQIIDRDRLDEILRQKLIEPYDGTDLNDYFKNTAGEALAEEFYKILAAVLPAGALKKIAIQESRGSYFEYQP